MAALIGLVPLFYYKQEFDADPNWGFMGWEMNLIITVNYGLAGWASQIFKYSYFLHLLLCYTNKLQSLSILQDEETKRNKTTCYPSDVHKNPLLPGT